MKYNKQQQSGFSLIETLVAISILLLVIVAPMTISSKTAKSSTFATEQIQAFFLAQEGLELAQAARNELQLKYFEGSQLDPWGEFVNGATYAECFSGSGCGLEWSSAVADSLVVSDCDTGTKCRMYLGVNDRQHFTYSSSGTTIQPFTRKIRITATPGATDREVLVTSTVTWRTGSLVADQKVELDTYLFNTYVN
ncbi:MAG: type II secretion system protein [Candidatus Nomurabacteria bacterium]|nr:MAG: type II secretion system protein [Candidatus Nomurabacteria bacterium]